MAKDGPETTHAAIDTVIIFTNRMTELARFYQEGFGLDAPEEMPGHIGFQLPGLYFGIDQADDPPHPRGGISLWFRVNNLEATFARLLRLGATIRYKPVTKPYGQRLASVYDPDGNLIGLAQRDPIDD